MLLRLLLPFHGALGRCVGHAVGQAMRATRSWRLTRLHILAPMSPGWLTREVEGTRVFES